LCWAVPGRVVDIIDKTMVRVDFGGVSREVLTGFETIKKGDLVMVHSGVVIGKTTGKEIVANLELFMEAERIGLQDLGLDPVAAKAKAEEEFRVLLGSLGLGSARQMTYRERPRGETA
jgi:hydrogenase maturation factor